MSQQYTKNDWDAIGIQKLKQDDEKEWNTILRWSKTLIPVMRRIFASSAQNTALFEDALQETLLALNRHLHTTDTFTSSLQSWMLRTFYNQLLNELRRKGVAQKYINQYTLKIALYEEEEFGFEFFLQNQEDEVTLYIKNLLQSKNARIDTDCQTILHETYWNDLGNAAIAQLLGKEWDSNRVRQRKGKCKENLKRWLMKQFPHIFSK